jgi:peptide chain release factor 1
VDLPYTTALQHASASVNGSGVFGVMKHESGVHRVQRIPATEGAGRTHTSTMSVAILPQPTEVMSGKGGGG